MYRHFVTVMLLIVSILGLTAIGGKYNLEQVQKVTVEDVDRFVEMIQGMSNNGTSGQFAERQNAIELGRTWYDYHTNNVLGRMLAHAYGSGTDGLHAVFMKILPQGATRYVTYDYYDESFGIFYGNQSVTENRQTGWGRVINGQNDEALISLHNNPTEIFQDASEAGYSFTSIAGTATNPGVFAGFGVSGDNMVFHTIHQNIAGQAWMPGNATFKYSTDYGSSWTDGGIIPPPPGTVEFSEAERWPLFNPTNTSEVGFGTAISEDAAASAGGWLAFATTTDWGANWNLDFIWHDDTSVTSSTFGNRTGLVIENFTQMNYMYTNDGNFHIVYGAVQGIRDTLTSTAIDYWPILHWDSNTHTFHEVTTLEYSAPNDPTTMAAMANNRPGNGLGNAYPHIAEGPNGTLVCIWQQWEADASGNVVLIDASTGGGTGTFQVFATDIWAAYSNDGGVTWQGHTKIAGAPQESDVYPCITENVIRNGDSLYLDILYMHDTNANVSLANFTNATDPSECIWYYERVAIYAPITGIDDPTTVVDRFSLAQNYPNPFNPSTTIKFEMKKRAKVTLEVFNTLGQKVATVLDEVVNPGERKVEFDAKDLTSGIYFYQLSADGLKQTKKMVLMK